MEALENSFNNTYSNGVESFSFVPSEEEKLIIDVQQKPAENKIIDPYVKDVLKLINNVRKEAREIEERAGYYKGNAGDRVFKKFNEKLIRLLINLDRIDVKGYEVLKEKKRDAIGYLKETQTVLKTR